MSLDPLARDVLVIVGVALAAVALLLGFLALLRTRRMRRDYTLLQADDRPESFLDSVARMTREVEGLRTDVARLDGLLGRTRTELSDAIRHVSVVRYDAFGDLGGRLSFSAALLDDGGDGLVLTSIHGRTETRAYMKGVRSGKADVVLSPEEEQAIESAMHGGVA